MSYLHEPFLVSASTIFFTYERMENAVAFMHVINVAVKLITAKLLKQQDSVQKCDCFL